MARPAFKNRDKLPYNHLLYERLAAADGVEIAEFSTRRLLLERWSVLHVHWPESLLETDNRWIARWSAAKALATLDLARRRGTRLVWTVHDLEPHDFVYPRLERGFWRAFMRRLDGVIGLTPGGLQAVSKASPPLGSMPSFVIPHGHFRDAYPRRHDRASARRALGLPQTATVVAFFGQIRPYKNVPALIRSFRETASADDILMVTGRPNRRAPIAAEVQAAAEGDLRIRLRLEFVPADEIELYMLVADLVVCPFLDVLNSGSAVLALSFDRPVLACDRGAFGELQAQIGRDWLRLYKGDLTPAVLRTALDWARNRAHGHHAPLGHLGWDGIAALHLEAYRAICSRPRS